MGDQSFEPPKRVDFSSISKPAPQKREHTWQETSDETLLMLPHGIFTKKTIDKIRENMLPFEERGQAAQSLKSISRAMFSESGKRERFNSYLVSNFVSAVKKKNMVAKYRQELENKRHVQRVLQGLGDGVVCFNDEDKLIREKTMKELMGSGGGGGGGGVGDDELEADAGAGATKSRRTRDEEEEMLLLGGPDSRPSSSHEQQQQSAGSGSGGSGSGGVLNEGEANLARMRKQRKLARVFFPFSAAAASYRTDAPQTRVQLEEEERREREWNAKVEQQLLLDQNAGRATARVTTSSTAAAAAAAASGHHRKQQSSGGGAGGGGRRAGGGGTRSKNGSAATSRNTSPRGSLLVSGGSGGSSTPTKSSSSGGGAGAGGGGGGGGASASAVAALLLEHQQRQDAGSEAAAAAGAAAAGGGGGGVSPLLQQEDHAGGGASASGAVSLDVFSSDAFNRGNAAIKAARHHQYIADEAVVKITAPRVLSALVEDAQRSEKAAASNLLFIRRWIKENLGKPSSTTTGAAAGDPNAYDAFFSAAAAAGSSSSSSSSLSSSAAAATGTLERVVLRIVLRSRAHIITAPMVELLFASHPAVVAVEHFLFAGSGGGGGGSVGVGGGGGGGGGGSGPLELFVSLLWDHTRCVGGVRSTGAPQLLAQLLKTWTKTSSSPFVSVGLEQLDGGGGGEFVARCSGVAAGMASGASFPTGGGADADLVFATKTAFRHAVVHASSRQEMRAVMRRSAARAPEPSPQEERARHEEKLRRLHPRMFPEPLLWPDLTSTQAASEGSSSSFRAPHSTATATATSSPPSSSSTSFSSTSSSSSFSEEPRLTAARARRLARAHVPCHLTSALQRRRSEREARPIPVYGAPPVPGPGPSASGYGYGGAPAGLPPRASAASSAYSATSSAREEQGYLSDFERFFYSAPSWTAAAAQQQQQQQGQEGGSGGGGSMWALNRLMEGAAQQRLQQQQQQPRHR